MSSDIPKCSVSKEECEWLNFAICSICGLATSEIKKCPYGKESYEGYSCYDEKYGTYIIADKYKEDGFVNDNVLFSGDNLMKYRGKRIKITVEVI